MALRWLHSIGAGGLIPLGDGQTEIRLIQSQESVYRVNGSLSSASLIMTSEVSFQDLIVSRTMFKTVET